MKLPLVIIAAYTFSFCDSKVFYNSRNGDVHKWKHPNSTPQEGKHWALLVSGGKGWYNYALQADVCHAYHIMKRNGIPEENIILMMYDDIAYHKKNPTPGVIINYPNGSNVYEGVKIDYKGDDVTSANFLAILTGNETLARSGKKVIQSGPNDHIFVYYADHGLPGIVGFPTGEPLHAADLISTLKAMHQEQKYKQMVIYIMACYSGSMFENLLPNDINIYATTSANPHESSWPCYLDEKLSVFISDDYSRNWMEDSDREVLDKESLHDQFLIDKRYTNSSHVQEYGDKSISLQMVSEFQAGPEYRPSPLPVPRIPCGGPVPLDEVPLSILKLRLKSAKDEATKQQLMREIDELLKLRDRVEKTMRDIVTLASDDIAQYERIYAEDPRDIDFDCYKPVFNLFNKRCYNVAKTYSASRQMKYLVNMCFEKIPSERIMEAIVRVCKE